jgi:ubiquinone/menaquinone biosynthesis C-methylase UbiE
MRWLESAPRRYEVGMRLITFGRVNRVHAFLAEAAARRPGGRVLEIGVGTGAVAARLLARGAHVTGLDQQPEMLELARERLADAPPQALDLLECTAAEIDRLPARAFDAVVASLSLSEMSRHERDYVLREAARRLRAGGVLAVADEVRPRGTLRRILFALLRGPQAALAWLIAGAVSRAIPDLASEIRAAGFRIREERRWLCGSLAAFIAEPAP